MAGSRQDPRSFKLPVDEIRRGFYSDAYFNRTRSILEQAGESPHVVMQVFQKNEAVLGGVDEALAVLRFCSGRQPEGGDREQAWQALTVKALHDGDSISPWETVMTVEGDYALFAHLETVYLGSLARATLIATNVRAAKAAAGGKPVLFFGARHDHYSVQRIDGYAASVVGIEHVSTDAQGDIWGARGMGTIPHSLIAAYGGDTVRATVAFADRYHPRVDIIALVDFDNDCVGTSLAVARELGDRLWGVRLDTADTLVDRSLQGEMGYFRPTGVEPELAWKVRRALDGEGYNQVKIVVSGGFDAARISRFEEAKAPVDAYGVGSSLLRGQNDFTADIVMLDGEPCAKVGRSHRPSGRLELVE